MTTPKIGRLRDWVVANIPLLGRFSLQPHEHDLAAHIRGNTPLHESLRTFITARINARASQPVPSEPIECRASMERDHELRWLLSRLDFIYRSPVNPAAQEDGEPPA